MTVLTISCLTGSHGIQSMEKDDEEIKVESKVLGLSDILTQPRIP
jgi:hypothetical protein